MVGLRLSDYDARWVHREGGTVIVRTGTTHPGMIQLAHNVFGPYGEVVATPRKNNRGEYYWEIGCYLDSSFGYLVSKPQGIPRRILDDTQPFLHCFAALVDGDGWISLHNCWGITAVAKLGFCNTDYRLIEDVVRGLSDLGYITKPRIGRRKNEKSDYGPLNNNMLRLEIKGKDAIKLLKSLPLRHPEKLMRRSLALQLHGKAWTYAKPCWDRLLISIKNDREKCIEEAKKTYEARGMVQNGLSRLSC